MSKELSSQPFSLQVGGKFHVTTNSLSVLDENMSFQELLAGGKSLAAVHNASVFWLGDLVNQCRLRFGNRYKDLADVIGYERQSLVNIAFVCNHIPSSDRVEGISFTHHREVVDLPSDKRLHYLNLAKSNNWSARQMRAAINGDAEKRPKQSVSKVPKFNLLRWSADGTRWLKKQEPVSKWSKERMDATLKDLKPFADAYHEIAQARLLSSME